MKMKKWGDNWMLPKLCFRDFTGQSVNPVKKTLKLAQQKTQFYVMPVYCFTPAF